MIRRYLTPHLLAILALGFASGLPRALCAATLGLWLTEAGISKASIGLFAAVSLPYSFKFLWAPLIDNLPFPILNRLFGRRRGWIFGSQALLAAALIALGGANPADDAWLTALFAVIVAALSATQDIVIDAYRVERLQPEDQTKGAAMAVFGYRIGMLASGAGALYLAHYFGWQFTYVCMAALLAVGTVAALFAGEPPVPADARQAVEAQLSGRISPRDWLYNAVIAPFRDFAHHSGWMLILLFVLLYKLGDAFLGVMTGPFLLELGFTKIDIANIGKLFGFVATVVGGFAGAWLAERLGLMRCLWLGSILNGVSNLAFLWLAATGPVLWIYAIVNSVENLTGAISGAVLVAYLSSLCNIRYTATQYALLSSLAAVGVTLFSTPAGVLAERIGWEGFFISSAALALPGLAVLYAMTRRNPKTA